MNISVQTNYPLILVVDDDRFMRIQLRGAMEQAGYTVAEATNGEEALAVYTKLLPDIVLLDALMPVMDGFTCCEQLKRLPNSDRTPILMITALEDQQSVDRAFEAGAADYITKPIHWAVLNQRVRYLLQASRTTQELKQQMERSLLREQQLRLALAAANMGTWEWDILSGRINWSNSLEALFGLTPGSFDGTYQSFIAKVHPEDRDLVNQAVLRAVEDGAEYNIELRVLLPNGKVRIAATQGQVYYDQTGKPVRMAGIYADITERKQIEALARTREQNLSDFLENASIGMHWVGENGQIIWANQAELNLLGYTPEEYIGQSIAKFHADPEAIEDILRRLKANETLHDYEARLQCKDGSIKYVLISSNVRWQGSKFIHTRCFTRDITERKQAEEELKRQNLRSQLFADITLKIRQSLQIEEILQTTVTEVQKFLQADRVLLFRLWSDGSGTVVQEAVVPGCIATLGQKLLDPCFQTNYIDKYRQGGISAIQDIDNSNLDPCHREFLQQFGVKANLVVPILIKDELWGLLIAHQCFKPRDWSSFETELLQQLANQIGIALAQAQMLEQETRQRQELARSNTELQQFASIASHDLQEPLRKIQAFGNRLKDKFGEALTDQGLDYLERMQNAAQRMQLLIEDLLTLSRVITKAQPFTPTNLTQIVQEVISDIEMQLLQTNGHIEVGELSTIYADPIQMRQLFQNLITNSLKFHREQEPPLINIHSELLQNQEVARGGEVCQIIVQDNGIGFDEKYLDRIFNPFQRLHSRSEYEGTGIGLAICRKIVERHGGSITAKSALGQGAAFIITLPVKQRQGDNSK